MFQQPKEIRIHVGAHKTATTHLQDTLALMEMELRDRNIVFLPRPAYRRRIKKAVNDSKMEQLRFSFLKRFYLSHLLMRNCNRNQTLVFSEENILGNCIDVCSVSPYTQRMPIFIRFLSSYIDTQLFLGIRSFDRVLPGAYTTALHYNPQRAMKRKNLLLEELKQGKTPSWIPLIARLRKEYPQTELTIWQQEEYVKKSDFYIKRFVGISDISIPKLEAPPITVTPSHEGVKIVEDIIGKPDFKLESDWPQKCAKIFQEHTSKSSDEKYTFLNRETQIRLQNSYHAEVKEIKEKWPTSFISGGSSIVQ